MKAIKIYDTDNVAVATEALSAGEVVDIFGEKITLCEDIPAGHKFALRPITKGENIIKYGSPIGHAKADVQVGYHVHTQNVKTNLGSLLEYEYTPDFADVKALTPRTFMGFKREDGTVGIRNEVWIVPTVGCVTLSFVKLSARLRSLLVEPSTVFMLITIPTVAPSLVLTLR